MNARNLKVKIYSDGADIERMKKDNKNPMIQGFTTNPTLMKQGGVKDYVAFAKEALKYITEKPISFEVFSDSYDGMKAEALEIASWGDNVYVKIPVINPDGTYNYDLISELANNGVKLNVTAIFTHDQVNEVLESLVEKVPAVISIFAGRIADTGVDPLDVMIHAVEEVESEIEWEILWASPREVFNIVQANNIHCEIITVSPGLIDKLGSLGKDLSVFSMETSKMFYDDAKKLGYKII